MRVPVHPPMLGLHPLTTSAGRLWRGFRGRFVEELLRAPLSDERCQLEALLQLRLAAIRGVEGDLDQWWEYLLEEENLDELMDSLDELLEHHNLTKVLAAWLRNRNRRIAKAWLRGDGTFRI